MRLSYRTVDVRGEVTLVIQKSRFIGTVAPVRTEEEARAFIDEIRAAHPEASHNCFAYRIGDGDELQRMSDDGEPSGTAGRPMLEVLDREQLHYAAAVVTRYFGGTLLGAAGLVRAYTQAVSEAIRAVGAVEKALLRAVHVTMDYSRFGRLEYDLPRRGLALEDIAYADEVSFAVYVKEEEVDAVEAWLLDATAGRAGIRRGDAVYRTVTG